MKKITKSGTTNEERALELLGPERAAALHAQCKDRGIDLAGELAALLAAGAAPELAIIRVLQRAGSRPTAADVAALAAAKNPAPEPGDTARSQPEAEPRPGE